MLGVVAVDEGRYKWVQSNHRSQLRLPGLVCVIVEAFPQARFRSWALNLYKTLLSRHKSNHSRTNVLGLVHVGDHLHDSILNSTIKHWLHPSQSVFGDPHLMGHVSWRLDILTRAPIFVLEQVSIGGTADGQSQSEELVAFKLEGKVTVHHNYCQWSYYWPAVWWF